MSAGPTPWQRRLGRALGTVATHVGPARPLVRRVNRRLWDRRAATWDDGLDPARRVGLLDLALDALDLDVARAADLGTGTGVGALHLARRFPAARVTGVDVSPRMVDVARAKAGDELAGRVTFVVGDAAALPFRDGELDLVVQINLPLVAGDLPRALRPGGAFVAVSSLGAGTPFHTPHRTAARLLARAGLDVVEIPGAEPETVLAARRP